MLPFTVLRPDGTEGTATCTLTVQDETYVESTKSLQGCMVSSKDENLKYFIQSGINPKDDKNIFSAHAFFFYAPYDEIIAKQAEKTVIQYPKYKDHGHYEDKQYPLERKVHPVVVDKSHIFILCESKNLNKLRTKFLRKPTFLDKHCIKGIRLNQSLGEEIYGLGKVDDNLYGFIKLKIAKCGESSSNEYKVEQSEDFEKLLDTGPILVDKHTLVGSFVKVKAQGSCRISCCVFKDVHKIEKDCTEHSDSEDGDGVGRREQRLKLSQEASDQDQPSTISTIEGKWIGKPEKEEKQTDCEKLKEKITQLKQWIERVAEEKKQLEKETMELKKQVENLGEKNEQLQTQQKEKFEQENMELKQRIENLEKENMELKQRVKKLEEENKWHERWQERQEKKMLKKEIKELKEQMEKPEKQTAS